VTLGLLLLLGVPGASGVAGLAAAATPSPSPTTGGELDPNDVSPGLLGFLVTFGLVVVCVVLFVSMTRMVRRVNRRVEPDEAAVPDPRDAGTRPGADPEA